MARQRRRVRLATLSSGSGSYWTQLQQQRGPRCPIGRALPFERAGRGTTGW